MNTENNEQFTPTSLTVGEIFNGENIYKIPNYQKQYEWLDNQVEELWENLYESFTSSKIKRTNATYFLGSIVVIDDKKGTEEIVDGQQRITTLMILFCVLSSSFPNINQDVNEENVPWVIKKNKIVSSIFNSIDKAKLQVQSNPSYDIAFEREIINNHKFETLKKPTLKELKEENPDNKYKNTAWILHNKLSELSEETRGEFVNYIFNSVKIIKIVCIEEAFAIKLFQVLNDKGLDLTSPNIIKSYLLEKISDDNKKELFMQDWKKIENNLESIKSINLDDFLVLYEYYKLKHNPEKSIVDELKKIFRETDANMSIKELLDFSVKLKEVFECKNRLIYSLRYLPWKFHVLTAIISAKEVKYEQFNELMYEIRRFFYICWISGKTLNNIKQTAFDLIKMIEDKNSLEDIKTLLNDKLIKDNMIETAISNIKEDVYHDNYIKGLLLSVDYTIGGAKKNGFIEIDKDLHIEHILPQKFKNLSGWNHIDTKYGNAVANTLGNLTLLIGEKDLDAENFRFYKKIQLYKGQGNEQCDISKIISFNITEKIINDFDTNKYEQNWNEKAINDRKTWLLDEIGKMLNIEII